MSMFNNSQSQENRITPEVHRLLVGCWNRFYQLAEDTQRALLAERPDLWNEPLTAQTLTRPAEQAAPVATVPTEAAAEVINLAAFREQKTQQESEDQQRMADQSRAVIGEIHDQSAA